MSSTNPRNLAEELIESAKTFRLGGDGSVDRFCKLFKEAQKSTDPELVSAVEIAQNIARKKIQERLQEIEKDFIPGSRNHLYK
jgi:hypothetical protein